MLLKIFLDMAPEISRTLKFKENGFVQFENLQIDVRERTRVEIVFKPYRTNGKSFIFRLKFQFTFSGILFYWSVPSDPHTDFIAFAMIDAKPHFVYELGSGLSYIR